MLITMLPLLLGATEVRLTIHVARDQRGPVASPKWVDNMVQRATELFAPAEICFRNRPLDDATVPAQILQVAERHILAANAPPDGSIHVFVVARAADKDRAGEWIGGVHWRYAGKEQRLRGRRYIILSRRDARPDTLAHELGHFFGLSHTKIPSNMMMSPGRLPQAHFSPKQVRKMSARLRWAISKGVISPEKNAAPLNKQ